MEYSRKELRYALDVLTLGANCDLPFELMRSAGEVHAAARKWIVHDTVQGLGIAPREGNPNVRQPLVIKVYLKRENKKLCRMIPSHLRVPGLGEPVDIEIEYVGAIEAQSAYVRHELPAKPGDAIGLKEVVFGTGTLGCLVQKRDNTRYILTAAHVIAMGEAISTDTLIYHPSVEMQGDQEATPIARLIDAIRPVIGIENFGNKLDAAIAKVLDPHSVDAALHVIGVPKGVGQPVSRFMPVHKVGAVTGYSSGRVIDLDAKIKVNYATGQAGFSGQVRCTDFTEPGDSGSLILNTDNEAVGLHLAGGIYRGQSSSYFTPIQRVLGNLDVDLITNGTNTEVELESTDIVTDFISRVLPQLTSLHRAFEDRPIGIAWKLTPIGLEIESRIKGTNGELVTVPNVWSRYQNFIVKWAEYYAVPVELIIATICTESHGRADAVRQEPDYISDEETPHQVSCGLMQTLISTASEAIGEEVDRNWLLNPSNSIMAGTAYIQSKRKVTHFDPPKVACAYNAGGLYFNNGDANRWKLRQYPLGTGKHADRFCAFFNDCFRYFRTGSSAPRLSLFRALNP